MKTSMYCSTTIKTKRVVLSRKLPTVVHPEETRFGGSELVHTGWIGKRREV
jgi:hypothetical protein